MLHTLGYADSRLLYRTHNRSFLHLWASHQNSYSKYDDRLYSVQSGSKYRWHAVKKFYLLKLLCKFIHTLTTYLTTMSVAKAIASSDGVISKQCQMGCDAIWSVTMYQSKITRWRSQLPNIRQTDRKKIITRIRVPNEEIPTPDTGTHWPCFAK